MQRSFGDDPIVNLVQHKTADSLELFVLARKVSFWTESTLQIDSDLFGDLN